MYLMFMFFKWILIFNIFMHVNFSYLCWKEYKIVEVLVIYLLIRLMHDVLLEP